MGKCLFAHLRNGDAWATINLLPTLHDYQELVPNDRGWLWCASLGLWLGTWYGTIKQETKTWLRFYDVTGQLLLLPEEDERRQKEDALQQAAQDRQRFEQLMERLRAQGIDVDNL